MLNSTYPLASSILTIERQRERERESLNIDLIAVMFARCRWRYISVTARGRASCDAASTRYPQRPEQFSASLYKKYPSAYTTIPRPDFRNCLIIIIKNNNNNNNNNNNEYLNALFGHHKTRVPGLLCGIVCVILRLAVSVEHRLVTDGRTDGLTDTRRQLISASVRG